MPLYIVLLGPPGAGKGTQARLISSKLGLPHISSGDLFREHFKMQTDLGKLAQGYIGRGELVPNDVTIFMVRERLSHPDCQGGALLDGFPRTPVQAEALDTMLAEINAKVDAVPYIEVPENVLIERLTGRWTCRAHGHVYHEQFNPPKKVGICDLDGSELYQRVDDEVETVTNRIRVYLNQTLPLISYYQQHGVLVKVDGSQPIEEVSIQLMDALTAGKV